MNHACSLGLGLLAVVPWSRGSRGPLSFVAFWLALPRSRTSLSHLFLSIKSAALLYFCGCGCCKNSSCERQGVFVGPLANWQNKSPPTEQMTAPVARLGFSSCPVLPERTHGEGGGGSSAEWSSQGNTRSQKKRGGHAKKERGLWPGTYHGNHGTTGAGRGRRRCYGALWSSRGPVVARGPRASVVGRQRAWPPRILSTDGCDVREDYWGGQPCSQAATSSAKFWK